MAKTKTSSWDPSEYKSLSETGNPELATVLKVVEALGLKLTAVPSDSDRAA